MKTVIIVGGRKKEKKGGGRGRVKYWRPGRMMCAKK